MKKSILVLSLVFALGSSMVAFANYNYNDWPRIVHWSDNYPTPQVVYDLDGLIPIGNFIERAGNVYFSYLNVVFL